MDTMTPNRLFPYTNALPMIDELREAVCKVDGETVIVPAMDAVLLRMDV